MRPRDLFLAAALAGSTIAVTTSAFANEHERTVKLSDIPIAAQQGLRREAQGGTILKVEEEHKGGQTRYEAHVKSDQGNEVGIVVDANGKLVNKHSEENDREM